MAANTGPVALGFLGVTLRLLRASWALWGRVSALGGRVWDLTTRVQEAEGIVITKRVHIYYEYGITSQKQLLGWSFGACLNSMMVVYIDHLG